MFKQCPRFSKGVEECLFAQISGGEVNIAGTSVPIKNAITLQAGTETVNPETGSERLVAALNGETLSRTSEPVPGGLLGLIKCDEIKGNGLLELAARVACEFTFENFFTGVGAVTELAKPAGEVGLNISNEFNSTGVALKLPVKVKLENYFLGSTCYIGSGSNPITLNLTTGTTNPPKPNNPISGVFGNLEAKSFEGVTYLEVPGNSLVDNAFAVPAASGCGGSFSSLIDPIIDAKLSLPSAAGYNTAIQTGNQFLAAAENVVKDEKGERE